MKKVKISLSPLTMTLDAGFSLARTTLPSVQARMDDALKQLYEQTVPEVKEGN